MYCPLGIIFVIFRFCLLGRVLLYLGSFCFLLSKLHRYCIQIGRSRFSAPNCAQFLLLCGWWWFNLALPVPSTTYKNYFRWHSRPTMMNAFYSLTMIIFKWKLLSIVLYYFQGSKDVSCIQQRTRRRGNYSTCNSALSLPTLPPRNPLKEFQMVPNWTQHWPINS